MTLQYVGEIMENASLKIEYKKFNSFLKDYVKTLSRGWIFLKMSKSYNKGTFLDFTFNVIDISEDIRAKGTVVFSGVNNEGSKGVGVRLDFSERSSELLKKKMPPALKEKYGEVWGGRICSLIEENCDDAK
jgi:Tfp pilus assembly protein PilZ